MRKNQRKLEKEMEEKLRALLQEGVVIPSEEFSLRLTHLVLEAYQPKQREEFKAAHWIGKCIISILLAGNLLLVLLLHPFSVQPLWIIAVLALLIGLLALVRLAKLFSVPGKVSWNR